MSVVNFAIPPTLERRVRTVVKEKGFPSRAELFRFAVLRYLDESDQFPLDRNPRIVALSEELGRVLTSKFASRPRPSLRSQLGRMRSL